MKPDSHLGQVYSCEDRGSRVTPARFARRFREKMELKEFQARSPR